MRVRDHLYRNEGNQHALALVPSDAREVLDVGCGAGDNARLLSARGCVVDGVTASAEEAALAASVLRDCFVADLEQGLPRALRERRYDTVLCCHVLEHLREPEQLVLELAGCLRTGGALVVAVPNVLFWRQRVQFMAGRFDYVTEGILDETHLRFYTYASADRLLARAPELSLEEKHATGSVPLWLLRRHVLSARLSQRIDAAGETLLPGLFGDQVLLRARKRA